ncbi:MAG: OmpA family protein [Hymenobacteraceae bacterium]|nr:OmpA family protein [Hymenobacteraceae bacterium]
MISFRLLTRRAGLTLALFAGRGAAAQPNLVPNPSFEEYDAKPREISQLNLARPWLSLATSGNEPAELFATGALARVGVPQNFNGTEPAHHGDAYAGFIPFSKMDDERYREFFVVQLTAPLEAGCTYRAACFVSLAERAHWAVDGVQILVSARGPLLIEQGYARAQPQVSAPQIIDQTAGWTEVSGMFRASGGEKVLSIGNFQLSSDTGARRRMARGKDKEAGDIAYYYLDDISLVKVMEADGSAARAPQPVVVASAPVLAPLPVPKKGQAVRLDNVYFTSDAARLLPASAPALDQLADLLTANATWAITIAGHTDNTNTDAHNLLLSHLRAESVRQYLIGKGIAPVRLKAAGYGDTKPVADNRTPQGREKNRRVEFTLE